jgi:PadR family transcriptional regulator, regulatory protein PadR
VDLDRTRARAYHVCKMTDPGSLGQFEQIVLAAILSLGKNAYGVTIHARVEELSAPKSVTRGAVYATLDRMEAKELVASWLAEPSKERGGRARRYYRLEKSGERALRESAMAAKRLYDTLARSWKGLAWKTER